jgi:hypothetical protein
MTISHNSFRDAAEFASAWTRHKTVDELLEGATRRQDKLVGLVIDAAIVTHLCHELAAKKSLEGMKKFFRMDESGNFYGLKRDKDAPKGAKDLTFSDLVTIFNSMNGIEDPSSRLELITNYVMNVLVDKGVLRTHRDLIDNEGWDKYVQGRDIYLADRRQQEKEGTHYHLVRPEDPRLTVCNEWTGSLLSIVDNGAKTRASAVSKSARRGQSDDSDFNASVVIKDINRVMVLPARPEVADTFFAILEQQIRQTVRGQSRTISEEYGNKPHLFVERWAVKPWGPFDRKGYVALHQNNPKDDKAVVEDDVHVAEIKAVGQAMYKAERLTSAIYRLQRELTDTSRYTPSTTKERKPSRKDTEALKPYEKERTTLKAMYEDCRRRYHRYADEHLLELKNGKPYLRPEFTFPPPVENFERGDQYENLRLALIKLNQAIHLHALKHEMNAEPWAKQFAFTAYYQHAAKEQMRLGKATKRAVEKSAVPTDRFDEGLLSKIGLSRDVLDKIKSEAYKAWQQDHRGITRDDMGSQRR